MPNERDQIKQLNVNIPLDQWETLSSLPHGYKQNLVTRFITDLIILMKSATSIAQLQQLFAALINGHIGLGHGEEALKEILSVKQR